MEVPLIFVIFNGLINIIVYIVVISRVIHLLSPLFSYFPIRSHTASTLVAAEARVLEMEKLPEFNGEEYIEDWLEIFECRAACSKITNEKTKIQWCRSVIGGVVRRILKGLSERSSW